ncbi:hypothetical protein HAX54_041058, partial [Datura stramonium]|nr:hypothetical protein [Datura stramonium]
MALPYGEVENMFLYVNDEVDYTSAIIPPRVNTTSLKIDGSIYTMLKVEGQFYNSIDNGPHQQLKKFW